MNQLGKVYRNKVQRNFFIWVDPDSSQVRNNIGKLGKIYPITKVLHLSPVLEMLFYLTVVLAIVLATSFVFHLAFERPFQLVTFVTQLALRQFSQHFGVCLTFEKRVQDGLG